MSVAISYLAHSFMSVVLAVITFGDISSLKAQRECFDGIYSVYWRLMRISTHHLLYLVNVIVNMCYWRRNGCFNQNVSVYMKLPKICSVNSFFSNGKREYLEQIYSAYWRWTYFKRDYSVSLRNATQFWLNLFYLLKVC